MAYLSKNDGLAVRPAKKATRNIGVGGKDTICLTIREKASLNRNYKRLEKRLRMKCTIKKGV